MNLDRTICFLSLEWVIIQPEMQKWVMEYYQFFITAMGIEFGIV